MIVQKWKKVLVCGIIVLFASIPATACLPVGAYTLKVESGHGIDPMAVEAIEDINITVYGTLGNNGWYVSPVIIVITIDDGINHTYYKLHAGDPWTEYTSPISVSTDDIYEAYAYYVDPMGGEHYAGPVPFKIDRTPPFIQLNETIGFRRWGFTIYVHDNMSGPGPIAIYINDLLVGNLTTLPFVFLWRGPVWLIIWKFFRTGDSSRLPTVVAYDMAGNSASKHAKALCLP
jgi:hypothetical protein